MIKASDAVLIHSSELRLAHRAEHLRRQFRWLKATISLPLVPTMEPMELDTSTPPEMEVMREISFFKRQGSRTRGAVAVLF